MKFIFLSLVVLGLCVSTALKSSVDFDQLFKVKKPIMAAIMLEGEYTSSKGKQAALDKAMEQLKVAQALGVDSILYEFRGGEILTPPISEKKFQAMVDITKKIIKAAGPVIIGVEILWHYPKETLRLAKESGARYVRMDFFSDEMIAEGGILVPIDPSEIIAYQKSIGAQDVLLLTDIQVKYAEMVDPTITMTQSATRAESLGTDAVVVSGKASGSAPGSERVRMARQGVYKAKVVIGSGLNFENAPDLLQYADGAIVGTSISTKTGGVLVPEKVRQLMKVVRSLR